ncbi:hypothetical protein GCM10011511_47730 [Puia dinghuensis]|uniref:SnoaL-like domain-containing protein n=2 Tax=Puia dinghuensis TaxID=1792502 RepID=A0A8J2XVU3_9BACT|nr:hypothetical protein GCM10011511_47730 [Puia dinghuensis]
MKPIESPYQIAYSSKFVIDDNKNAESVLKLWKVYDNGDLSAGKDLIADSIRIYLGDGTEMRGSRDSMTAAVQAFRNSFAAAVSRVDAVMAVKSTDKNEHWALIWGTETDTHKDGKIDSTDLQETWRFNKDGKADVVYQYARPLGRQKMMSPKMTRKKK